jgi:hypothetical protein
MLSRSRCRRVDGVAVDLISGTPLCPSATVAE